MVCAKAEEGAEMGGGGGGEAEEAGYRIKNKNPTQRCGGKKNCQETPRMKDEIPTLMFGFIEKRQGTTLQVEKKRWLIDNGKPKTISLLICQPWIHVDQSWNVKFRLLPTCV